MEAILHDLYDNSVPNPGGTSDGGVVGAPPPGPPGGLKEFVEEFKDKHYHVIEMRILLVCSFGIFLKLFLSEALSQEDDPLLTYSALTFIAREWAGQRAE